ncbi:MAG: hypothetical protein BM556_09020 [Bacteriovorax sp. MedPE-SWde]|nr:MAG: hypothetical protein BM556_09020 [Bacteriovorax sp. MedPE-SWde]
MNIEEYQRNYDLEKNYWFFVGMHKMIMNLVGSSPLKKHVDIGCGTGGLLETLSTQTEELYGFDISDEALKFCKQRGYPEHLLIKGDGVALPFEDNSFDSVTAIGVIEHIEDDQKFIEELYRILKPGGELVMVTSSFQLLWSSHDVANHHIRRYTLTGLSKQMRMSGFQQLKLSHFNFFLFPAIAFVLIMDRFFTKKGAEERILPIPNKLINGILTSILSVEALLMKWVRLPFGISLIGKFKKPN